MKKGVVEIIFFVSLFYKSFQFIIIDEELETVFDKNSKIDNVSRGNINESDYDLNQLFQIYDEVFNLTEQLDPNVTLTYNKTVSVIGIDMVNITKNRARDLINPDNITAKSESTDTFLMESVERIGDVQIENEFINEVKNVQNLFIEDKNANIDLRMNNTEEFVDYNAKYGEKVFFETIKNTTSIVNNTLIIDSDILNRTFGMFFLQQSEENIESYIEKNSSNMEPNGTLEFDSEGVVVDDTTVSNQMWNITDPNLTFASTDDISGKVFEIKKHEEEYDKDKFFIANNIKQNFAINDLMEVTTSTKLARDITEIAVKNALSQEKPKIPDTIVAKTYKTINMITVLMILLSALALCLLLGVIITLSLQKFHWLRHTISPA